MCATCGCGESGADGADHVVVTLAGETPRHPDHDHHHDHEHGHEHPHDHEHRRTETVTLEQRVLAKNDLLAERNRAWLTARGISTLNITSSPGAGKTTLLERTIGDLGHTHPVAVIEGDQQTLLDADRIRAAGARAVQINTGAGCHLDAAMVHRALGILDPAPGSLLFIENVGNLVCPALFDLGELDKVVVISVTEGTDKPLKYPHMFAAAGVVILNKIDLLPYVDFDVGRCCGYARSVNPNVTILQTSATRGDGLAEWYEWLATRMNAKIH
ncbi:hydrogenase nickel incorporation protein HypB [Mycolicibacterium goodii]|uniref:Hydrogenase nickel incorporation protein HypB n=1 Tax=Mycolicibacterium goodii TaxID=134601 RepID=A0A0K0XBI2_MYCGD|nr:hydrogenase nickel incorporation protein HypB [Mycolicibacterium goodii]